MTEHKHAEVLRAIADGKKVQCRPKGYYGNADWFVPMDILNPLNRPDYEWRVKPEPKPDRVQYWNMGSHVALLVAEIRIANLRLTLDGETDKLKYAVVLG